MSFRVRFPATAVVKIVVILAMGVVSTGCDIPKRPPLAKKSKKPKATYTDPSEDDSSGEPFEIAGGRIDVGWKTWDAYYVGDRHVGYNFIRCELEQDGGEDDIVYQTDNVLFINQGQSRTLQRLRQTTKETKGGRLINFDSSLQVGPVLTKHNGILSGLNGEGSLLQVETMRGSQRSTKTIDWDKTNRGLLAIEQSLKNRPLINKGETRSIKVLLSGYYDVAIARLKCSGDAYVPMLDGESLKLIEINYEIENTDGNASYSTLWIDAAGNVRRTYTPGIDLVSYRTDKQTATNLPQSIDQPLWLPVAGKIDRPTQAKRIGYEVSPLPGLIERTPEEDRDYLFDIIAAPHQMVRQTGSSGFQVLVSRDAESDRRGFEKSDLTPSKYDTAPSKHINFQHRMVRQFANAAAASKSLGKEEIAIEMTRTVKSLIQKDPSKIGLVNASDVATLSSANELGRAIFLCAMLRAKKIPARVALGLRYQNPDPLPISVTKNAVTKNAVTKDAATKDDAKEQKQGNEKVEEEEEQPQQPARMVFHPWAIAYIDDRWLPLDVESGGIAPPDRITLSTATFADKSEYRAFIPLLEATSRMQINVLRAQY